MNTNLLAYVVSIGWLSGRLLTLLLETTGQAAYTVNQTHTLKKLGKKYSRSGKRSFNLAADNRFKLEKEFNNKANTYFAATQTNVIIPAITLRPNQTIVGLVQEFDSLRQNVHLMLAASSTPSYALQRIKPLKKPQEAYFADDLQLIADPLRSYWQLARFNVNAQMGSVNTYSTFKHIRKNFIGFILLLEPFIIGYFGYLAVKFERAEPLALAFSITIFSLMFYVIADRHRRFIQKVRLLFLSPAVTLMIYLLELTRFVALIRTIVVRTREDWAKWQAPIA